MTFNFEPFDWNAIGALASLASLGVAVVAAIYAYRQYSEWRDDRDAQAKVLGPALLAEFNMSIRDLRERAAELRTAVRSESLSALAGRGRTLKITSTSVTDRMLDKYTLFGSRDGIALASAAASILRVNALLDQFSEMRAKDGVLEHIADAARRIADEMDDAVTISEIARDKLRARTGLAL